MYIILDNPSLLSSTNASNSRQIYKIYCLPPRLGGSKGRGVDVRVPAVGIVVFTVKDLQDCEQEPPKGYYGKEICVKEEDMKGNDPAWIMLGEASYG
jgi:hypothetical protein